MKKSLKQIVKLQLKILQSVKQSMKTKNNIKQTRDHKVSTFYKSEIHIELVVWSRIIRLENKLILSLQSKKPRLHEKVTNIQ
jgi:hypothetical protein